MGPRNVAIVGLVGALGAGPATASPTVTLHGEDYSATGFGAWSCGPRARVHTSGIGGEARLQGRAVDEDSPRGIHGGIAASAQGQVHRFVACSDGTLACSGDGRAVPPPTLQIAGRLRVGYDSRWWGVAMGALAYPFLEKATDRAPTWNGFPELQLRVGRLTQFHGDLTLGTVSPSTLTRPGLSLGLEGPLSPRLVAFGRGGIHRSVGNSAPPRLEAGLRGRMVDHLWLGSSFALSLAAEPGAKVGPETRVFVVWNP